MVELLLHMCCSGQVLDFLRDTLRHVANLMLQVHQQSYKMEDVEVEVTETVMEEFDEEIEEIVLEDAVVPIVVSNSFLDSPSSRITVMVCVHRRG